jgi:replicative DNA helicase
VAHELAELYQKRLLAELAQTFLGDLRSETSSDGLITSLEQNLARVQQTVKELEAGRVLSLSELYPLVIEDIAERWQAVKEKGKAAVGLPTGFPLLDRLLGGVQPGVHLLAAEPGQGKTTLLVQIGAHVAKTGIPVLLVSFEEALIRLALKCLCQQARVPMKKFADGYGSPQELEKAVKKEGDGWWDYFCLLEGSSKVTARHIKAKALQLMAHHKSDQCLIMVDYLQRWAAANKEFCDFRHIVSGLVTELRELALRLACPVMVVSSQNRPGQGTSSLTSLKESGDLEYAADTALFLVENKDRMAKPPCRAVDLKIEKNRYGDKGSVRLVFNPEIGFFCEDTTV